MKTAERIFTRGGTKYRIRAEYGLRKIGDQAPYFSITGEIDRQARNGRWVEDCGGCIHGEIAKLFPKLRPLIRWHLCSKKGPMHYLANSKYWFGVGEYSERNLDYFKSTCVYGAVEGDTEFDLENADWPAVETWLVERFPGLLDKFQEELREFGVS